MKVIRDNPDGWAVYCTKVKELVCRPLSREEYKDMLQAYIKPLPADQFAATLTK